MRSRRPRGVLLLAFAGTSVLNYAFSLTMGWLLLPGDFGWLAFAQTLLLVCGFVLQSGFPWTLARSLPNAPKHDHGGLVRGGIAANTAVAAAMAGGVALGYFAGPLRGALETGTATAFVCLALPFIGVAVVARAAAQGVEEFRTVAVLQVVEVVAKAVLGTVLVVAGLGVVGALAGFVVGGMLAAAVGVRYVHRRFGIGMRGPVRVPSARVALPTFGALLALALLLNLDLLAVKTLGGSRADAGLYQAGIVLANLPYFIVTSTIVPVLYVESAKRGRAGRSGLADALRLTIALAIPVEVIFLLAPHTSLDTFFPSAYAGAEEALQLLAVGNAFLIFTAIFVADGLARGRAGLPAIVLTCLAAADAVALAFVVPRYGTTGAAATFAAAAALSAGTMLALTLYSGGLRPRSVPLRWLARYAAVGCVSLAAGWAAHRAGAPSVLAIALSFAGYGALASLSGVIDARALLFTARR